MPFRDFIYNISNEQRKLVRSLEHLYKKLIKANFALTFNIYIYIYIYIYIIYMGVNLYTFVGTPAPTMAQMGTHNSCASTKIIKAPTRALLLGHPQ